MEFILSPYGLVVTIFIFIFGSAIGSFLNVLSDRLPNDESILGRSHCEKCKHELSWMDLFPVFSFLFLRGKCRYCKTKLSFFYPGVEVVTGLLFVITFNVFLGTMLPIYFVIVSAMLVVFFADLKYQIIPDSMQIILLISGLALRLLTTGYDWGSPLQALGEGVVIMAPILLLFLITRGKGMGFGDVKLAFVIGVLFGIKLGAIILYLSFILGAAAGVFLILRKKKKLKSKIAFGPFIVLAMFIGLFFRDYLFAIVSRIWGI